MARTPAIRKTLHHLRNAILAVAALLVFIFVFEVIRIALILHPLHPLLGWSVVGVVLLALLVIALRIGGHILDHRTLMPPERPGSAGSYSEYRDACRHQIALLKRLGQLDHLDEETRQRIRQAAYDLQGTLGHHPLKDDLRSAIAQTTERHLVPTHGILRDRALAFSRDRMKAVVRSAVEPPFPVMNSFAFIFLQVVTVTRIVDLYVARPSMVEYYLVVRDVLRVITDGNFFHVGQRLFEGVYTNIPPMGAAVDDLGQALTSIWLTRTVAMAAILRCEAMTPWITADAVLALDAHTADSLAATKESLIQDALPILRLRIRHSAPLGVTDAAGFTESVIEGITKAVDTVVKSLRHQAPEQAAATVRRASVPDVVDNWASAEPVVVRRRRRRRKSGLLDALGIVRSFGQRVKYSVKGRGFTKP